MSKPLYRINNIFCTIQGEGKYAGYSACFIRTAHCNLRCSWCDTEFDSYKALTIDEIRKKIKQKAVFVITGGEPTINNVLYPLLYMLTIEYKNTPIIIESNGSIEIRKTKKNNLYPIVAKCHYTVSPKEYTKNLSLEPFYVHPNNWPLVKEIKWVVDKSIRQAGLRKAIQNLDFYVKNTQTNKNITYSLSPEWNEMDTNVKFIHRLQQQRPLWRLSLQTHKWINFP